MDAVAEQQLLIVTGMSGAGRSTAANALEDLGWYVVDNLPPQMIDPLFQLMQRAEGLPRIAAVVDVRGSRLFSDMLTIIQTLKSDPDVGLLFLEATDEVLVQRFEQVRRPHPLQGGGTLLDGIAEERMQLSELRSAADVIIDTSQLNIHQLATQVGDLFREEGDPLLRLTFMSFGFKYGVPADADIVLDARFLPNPFWIPELRPHNGLEAEVSEYVLSRPGAQEFLSSVEALLKPVTAGYQTENKRHATIAVGCTGGKHRSVAMVERLAAAVGSWDGVAVTTRHRDLGRE